MPEPLPAAATTGSHTDMPGGWVVISITASCWSSPGNWSPHDWRQELISWHKPHFFLALSHLTHFAVYKQLGSDLDRGGNTGKGFRDLPIKTIFAAKGLGHAHNQCTCQSPGKDAKVLAVQKMVKASRNLAFVKLKLRKAIPIQKTCTA